MIQEDTRTGGFGQTVVGEVTSNPDTFSLLLSSPQLVARNDVHIGYNPIYEYAALPSIDDVVAACRTAMS
ncbi:MAG: hypothetical protein R2688_10505 [Fimbriimonadaceae bacterium]